MACVGQVLSVLPFEEIMENLKPILTPHLQQLEQLTTQEVYYTVVRENMNKIQGQGKVREI